jgi:hypothetical protein
LLDLQNSRLADGVPERLPDRKAASVAAIFHRYRRVFWIQPAGVMQDWNTE